jgi:glycosyltransferase involved in cell wall biosynthesis
MSGDARPRVLQLLVGFDIGGAEQLVLDTAPRLRALGFDLRVAALKGAGPLLGELEAAGVPAVALDARHRGDLGVVLRLAGLLRRERIDLLHSHLYIANLAGRVAGRIAGVPVILSAQHDTDLWMRPHHRLIERLSARLADRVIACSEAVRAWQIDAVGLPPAKLTTLRNAIVPPADPGESERDAARTALGAAPEDLVVGTLGRLFEPKKGLRIFIDAAVAVAARAPRARFVVAGEGPARAELEMRARHAGLGPRLIFAGARRDVPVLLSAYDLFVQPSLWEGFGLTVVEAMAVGRPVVASQVGGIPEIVRHGRDGLLVAPGDAGALADAIVDLLDDPERRARFAAEGRRRARTEFHIDRLVGETAALYRDALERRGVSASGTMARGWAA